MDKIQFLSILVTAGLFGLVFELVRRRRLAERYALLWLFASVLMLVLAVWRDLLDEVSRAIGVSYGPSLLFAIAFAFVVVMLLHFSLWISRLAEETRVLAQHVGALRQRVDELERAADGEHERAGVR